MKLIRLALSYSYHLPKLLVSEKLYCVMLSIVYIVHIWDKSIVSLFCVL